MNKRTVLVQGIRLLFWSLFAGLFVGGIIGGLRLVRQLEVPSPEISAALIAGALGLIGVLWNQRSISRRQIEAAHHEQKAHVYSTFVDDIVMGTLQRTVDRANNQLSRREMREMVQAYRNFTGKLMVWGSGDFMKQFSGFIKAAGDEQSGEILLRLDDVLRSMRSDLGHRDFGMQRGDVVKIILKNPEELDGIIDSE